MKEVYPFFEKSPYMQIINSADSCKMFCYNESTSLYEQRKTCWHTKTYCSLILAQSLSVVQLANNNHNWNNNDNSNAIISKWEKPWRILFQHGARYSKISRKNIGHWLLTFSLLPGPPTQKKQRIVNYLGAKVYHVHKWI